MTHIVLRLANRALSFSPILYFRHTFESRSQIGNPILSLGKKRVLLAQSAHILHRDNPDGRGAILLNNHPALAAGDAVDDIAEVLANVGSGHHRGFV